MQTIIRKDSLRRKADGTVKVPWTCFYEFVDREGVTRVGKGRQFEIEGRTLELFPVGVLVAALGRTRRTLYVWEKDFGFPQAMFRVRDDRNCNRWYSRRQLQLILTVYGQLGRLQKENRNKLAQFVTAVRTLFYSIDTPAEKRETH